MNQKKILIALSISLAGIIGVCIFPNIHKAQGETLVRTWKEVVPGDSSKTKQKQGKLDSTQAKAIAVDTILHTEEMEFDPVIYSRSYQFKRIKMENANQKKAPTEKKVAIKK